MKPSVKKSNTREQGANIQNETTKPQTKPPVDREAVRVLAIELGAREAARRLGLNPNTVLSWAKRYNWELPNRKGGVTKASANAITLQSKPGDVLLTVHKELEGRTKTGLAQATAKASEHAAKLKATQSWSVRPQSGTLPQLQPESSAGMVTEGQQSP